jgi:hypothetical protein
MTRALWWGSSTSSSTPALSSVKTSSTSYFAASPVATAEATLSALVLSSSPEREQVMGEMTGVAPASSSIDSASTFTASTSPTKPQSISPTGRRCETTMPMSQPESPQAFTPRACNAAVTRLFARPP